MIYLLLPFHVNANTSRALDSICQLLGRPASRMDTALITAGQKTNERFLELIISIWFIRKITLRGQWTATTTTARMHRQCWVQLISVWSTNGPTTTHRLLLWLFIPPKISSPFMGSISDSFYPRNMDRSFWWVWLKCLRAINYNGHKSRCRYRNRIPFTGGVILIDAIPPLLNVLPVQFDSHTLCHCRTDDGGQASKWERVQANGYIPVRRIPKINNLHDGNR